ncbi:hypothetical protein ACLB2K_013447 [Fragaria x ananassa]
MKQAYPPIRFDFGEGVDLTSVMLTFKYERICGFCKLCGLLEHKAGGCQGPPDMSALNGNHFAAFGSRTQPQTLVSTSGSVVFTQPASAPPMLHRAKAEIPNLTGKKCNASVLMGLDLGKRPSLLARGPIG